MEVKLASPRWGILPPDLGKLYHISTWTERPLRGWGVGGGEGNNKNDGDAEPPCPVPPLWALTQRPKISPSSLMTEMGTKARMPSLTSPLPKPSTARVGRRRGRGRRRPTCHRDIWRPPLRIGPALLHLLVCITRGTDRTEKQALPWYPIPYNAGRFFETISTYMCYLNVHVSL